MIMRFAGRQPPFQRALTTVPTMKHRLWLNHFPIRGWAGTGGAVRQGDAQTRAAVQTQIMQVDVPSSRSLDSLPQSVDLTDDPERRAGWREAASGHPPPRHEVLWPAT